MKPAKLMMTGRTTDEVDGRASVHFELYVTEDAYLCSVQESLMFPLPSVLRLTAQAPLPYFPLLTACEKALQISLPRMMLVTSDNASLTDHKSVALRAAHQRWPCVSSLASFVAVAEAWLAEKCQFARSFLPQVPSLHLSPLFSESVGALAMVADPLVFVFSMSFPCPVSSNVSVSPLLKRVSHNGCQKGPKPATYPRATCGASHKRCISSAVFPTALNQID